MPKETRDDNTNVLAPKLKQNRFHMNVDREILTTFEEISFLMQPIQLIGCDECNR